MTDRLLIVIPVLNEEAHIGAVLASLLAQTPDEATVIVADGRSTDATRQIVAAFPRVTLLDNPDRLQAAAINLAVHTFGHDRTLLLRADAHARYPADFIPALLAELHATGADSITVPMHTLGTTPFTKAVAAAQNSLLGTGGSAHRMARGGRFVDHGHHALMRLAAFRAVGGYDPRQSHNEDAELDHRLTRAGNRIWLTGKTGIGYVPRDSFAGLFRQYFRHGRGRAMTVRKHGMRLRLRQMAPLAVPFAVALALVGAAAAPLFPLAAGLALPALVWMAVCLIFGAVLSLQARSLPIILAGPAAMVMHLGWGLGFLTAPRQ